MDLSTTLQVAQLGAYLVIGTVFVVMIKSDIRVVRHDMKNLHTRQDALNLGFTQLTTILTQVAVQDQRIKAIEDDIRELRHGKGYVRDD